MKRFALLWLTLFLLTGLAIAGPLKDAQKALSKIHSLKGTFSQRNFYSQLGEAFEFRGEFVLKRPDSLRWQYTKGSEDMVYVVGTKATLIQPEERQAIVQDTKALGITRAPILFIFDEDLINKDFKVQKETPQKVVLRPLNDSMGLKRVVLVLGGKDRFPVKGLVFEDSYGNIIEVNFTSVQINPSVKDTEFRFKIPEGYTVLNPPSG